MAEFGASIFLGGPWDWARTGAGGRSRCQEMVDRVEQNNIHFVQFVPTLYWCAPPTPLAPGSDTSASHLTPSVAPRPGAGTTLARASPGPRASTPPAVGAT